MFTVPTCFLLSMSLFLLVGPCWFQNKAIYNLPSLKQHVNIIIFIFICISLSLRMAPFDGSAWEEEEEDLPTLPEVPYYNNFPGKQPPPGGLVDMRTRAGHSTGATLVRHTFVRTCVSEHWCWGFKNSFFQ